jgi:formylglycine-generating enzyme required for sulfatase activity
VTVFRYAAGAGVIVLAACSNPAGSNRLVIDPGTHVSLVRIPAGHFSMGSPDSEPTRGPDEVRHDVTLTREFYLGQDEVTQNEWADVIGTRPSQHANCGSCTVERIN